MTGEQVRIWKVLMFYPNTSLEAEKNHEKRQRERNKGMKK
jgi:hypothetical protein